MIQKPRGTQDLFTHEVQKYQHLENLMHQIFKTYHLSEIRTPIFEAQELFVRSIGSTSDVVNKEMYEFLDKKGRKLVLRPEGTAPIVRALIENKLTNPTFWPWKFYYQGLMFRYERPQIGRHRQFEQIGVEFFGGKNVDQDWEVLALVAQILKSLKLEKKITFDLNFLVVGPAREKYIHDLKQYLKTIAHLCSDCQTRMKVNPLRVLDCKIDGVRLTNAPKMNEYWTIDETTEFSEISNNLKALGLNPVLNPQLVRGLDYYTGLIFEVKYASKQLGSQSTILAGGRYDNLVAELGGPSIPAIGFALGLERVLIALDENHFFQDWGEKIDLYIIPVDEIGRKFNQKLLFELRSAGIIAETDFLNRSLKSNFKQAEKFQAKNLFFLGQKEVESQMVRVKNQTTKKEKTVPIGDLIKTLKE